MLLEREETGDQQKATGMSTDLGMRSFTLMERVFSKLDIPKA